ncbi:MAG TPA: hypothetical protein VMP68_17045 [Candidatus Eisenbacteria bacterium]|nr:hypothetical protein [Candidatus Eisenbacteria bacterium]
MRTRVSAVVCFVIFVSFSFIAVAQAQQSDSVQLAHEQALLTFNDIGDRGNNGTITDIGSRPDDPTVEGTVVSSSQETLVVRTSDDQFYLFTYENPSVRTKGAVPGATVRVAAGAPDESGSRVATNVAVVRPPASGGPGESTVKAAPVPEKVQNVENEIKRESRRWDLGIRAGAAFDPELFMFGVQSRMGPIFHSRVFFRPNAEFAFGEVTDLIGLNLEGIYQFASKDQINNWRPYAGAGPALIFIHQSYQQGRNINFGNFDYETGFNVLFGMRKNRTFVELKSSLWSGPAPKLRIIFGYTF